MRIRTLYGRLLSLPLVVPVLLFPAFAASLRQEDIGPGLTRVTYRFNFSTRPRWLRAITGPIATVLFRREVRQRLEALKSYLERPR